MNPLFVCEIIAGLFLQVSIVVLVTVAIESKLKNSASMCRLWTVCFVAILGLVCAAMLLPHLRPPAVWSNDSSQTMRAIITLETGIGKAFVLVWSLGIVVNLAIRGIWFMQLTRFLQDRCEAMSIKQIKQLLKARVDLPDHLRLLVSDDIQGPFCWQLHRPTIVLPRFVLSEDLGTVRHVVLHELEHLRTNHPLQLFLQRLCTTIMWFHPIVWWAGRRAELAREYHCDEVAARGGDRISNYLRTLVKIAERGVVTPPCVLAFGRRRSALAQRTERLVRLAKTPPSFSARRQSLAMTALLLISIVATQIWLPVNVLASPRSRISPWPKWSAHVLHDFGISVRDFERFDERIELHDLFVSDD